VHITRSCSSGTVAKLFDCVQPETSGAARDEAGETKIAADRSKVPGGTSNSCRYELVGYRAQSIPLLWAYEYRYVGIYRIAQVAADEARCL